MIILYIISLLIVRSHPSDINLRIIFFILSIKLKKRNIHVLIKTNITITV